MLCGVGVKEGEGEVGVYKIQLPVWCDKMEPPPSMYQKHRPERNVDCHLKYELYA